MLWLFTRESEAWHTVVVIICRYLRRNLKLGMLVGGYRVPRKVFVFSACRRL